MLTQERLKELLTYDENTGFFIWNFNRKGNSRKGAIAGSKAKDGYAQIMIDKRQYRSHRLAWLYVYGHFPTQELDHINLIPNDNRISNLREATREQNQQNKKKAQKNNKSGFLGVSTQKGQRWRAAIYLNGKRYHLGVFNSPELAHEAYLSAKRKMHTHCTI